MEFANHLREPPHYRIWYNGRSVYDNRKFPARLSIEYPKRVSGKTPEEIESACRFFVEALASRLESLGYGMPSISTDRNSHGQWFTVILSDTQNNESGKDDDGQREAVKDATSYAQEQLQGREKKMESDERLQSELLARKLLGPYRDKIGMKEFSSLVDRFGEETRVVRKGRGG